LLKPRLSDFWYYLNLRLPETKSEARVEIYTRASL
jgi:hypothetical protein